MKKNLFKTLCVSAFVLMLSTTIACRENKNTDEVNRYDSIPEQERLHNDPDPLNERDASGGTIDNHQGRTATKTDDMNDTVNSVNSSSDNQ